MPLTDPQVIAAFGDPLPYIRRDGTIDESWATTKLSLVPLPAPLPLSWDTRHTVTTLRVHRRLVEPYRAALDAVHANPAAWASLGSTGGAYCWRPIRGSGKRRLSRHSWGIAVDLDVADNELGTAGKMHPAVIAAFAAEGFEWGGAWKSRKDPMHFEFSDLGRLA